MARNRPVATLKSLYGALKGMPDVSEIELHPDGTIKRVTRGQVAAVAARAPEKKGPQGEPMFPKMSAVAGLSLVAPDFPLEAPK